MSSTIWDKIFRNTLSHFASTAVSVVVGFALLPFMLSHIGVVGFGLWALVTGLVGSMGLLDAGLAPTLTKQSAELLAKGDEAELNKTASKIFTLYLLVGVGTCVAMWTLSFLVSRVFTVSPEHLTLFQTMLLVVGIQLALSFPLSTWTGIMSGLQDFHIINAIGIASTIVRATLIVALLKSGHGLISLLLAGLGVAIAGWIASVLWVQYRLPYLRIRASFRNLTNIKNTLRFSGAMFIWGIAGRSLLESNRIIIGIFLPVASISVYEIGLRINNYSRSILYAVFTVLPAASDLHARNEKEQLQKLYLIGTKYLLVPYTCVVAALLMFGKEFVYLWVGNGYEQAVTVMYILLLGSVYQSQNLVAHVLLPGMGKIRVFTLVMAAYPIVNLILSVIFLIEWGLIGVAVATSITYLIVETYFIAFIVRVFEVRLSEVLWKCHFPAIISVIPAIVASYYFKSVIDTYSWVGLVTGVGVFLILAGSSFLLFGMSRGERHKVKSKMLAVFSQPRSVLDEVS